MLAQLLANSAIDTAAENFGNWLSTISPRILVGAVCLIALLFVYGLVKKLIWLTVVIAILAVIVGGLWIIGGQTIP